MLSDIAITSKMCTISLGFGIVIAVGQPHTLMVDKGGEWNTVRDHIDVLQMRSVFNQVSFLFTYFIIFKILI